MGFYSEKEDFLLSLRRLFTRVFMKRLENIGFKKAGNWLLESEKLDFRLSENFVDGSNVVYAFVVDGSVKYVGQSKRTLRERMGNYKSYDKSQSTNEKNNANIKKELLSGKSVDIYAFVDTGLLSYGEFGINLAAGLEDSIIKAIVPDWNER